MSELVRLFLLALLAGAFAGPPAAAATVTVGSPLTGSFNPESFCTPVCIIANSKFPEAGAQVTSPASGTVTRWRTIAGSSGAFRLRILHPVGGGDYALAGTSAAETPIGPGIDTFATNLPIQAGDLIGLENVSTTAVLGTANPYGSEYHAWFGSFADGASTATASGDFEIPGQEFGFNADVEFPVTPPPTATPPARCAVPKLKARKLKAAKKAIKAAYCKVGKVSRRKGATAAGGKVVGQSPKAGATVPAGTKVIITIAAPWHPREASD